ncbi:hypothetical protein LIER_16705 [Lithospermum erythrorhizon]|uniref:Altered inheritance of mitochondria protein 32 n=1 Tax=Lithospermum erythrorhizon TaxID=34254 RepID=A0AAV3QAB7_LITER
MVLKQCIIIFWPSPTKKPIIKTISSLSQLYHKPNNKNNISSASSNSTYIMAAADVEVEDDVKYGFKRGEMYESNINGTVDPPYARHVFLCYKSHQAWPPRLEASDADPLPKLFAQTLKARRNDIKIRTRFTVCEGGEDIGLLDGDVLLFPEMIKYSGLEETNVESFVDDVLVSGKQWDFGVPEELTGSYVFVCAHNLRDRRCGVCGPVLIEKFKEETVAKDLNDQVFVTACSHIGGHKYAGNLIIFSAGAEGKINGHWYGYVTPDDVTELLDEHIGKGKIIQRIWRGQMGAGAKEPEKFEEQKQINGTASKDVKENSQEVGAGVQKESVGSCCQGVNGFQCCRDGGFEEEKPEKGLRGMFGWTGKWEQREVLAAVSVVGAVAVVAVAYGFYKKSK